jgi:hypothetical protein
MSLLMPITSRRNSLWQWPLMLTTAGALLANACCAADVEPTSEPAPQHVAPWRTLKSVESIGPRNNIEFYELLTENGSIAYLCVLSIKDTGLIIAPFFNESNTPTSSVARKHNALVAINGGFFNLNDGESTSYIVIDGKPQCEPKENKSLVNNPKLKPFLKVIFNRSELRILTDNNGARSIQIAKHNDPIPHGLRLQGSIQAGPQLLPVLTDEQEAFVRTAPGGAHGGTTHSGAMVDSIGSHKTAARTACGITSDGHLMLVCVANKRQNEYSAGVTLAQLADMLRKLGCQRAVNFDGGTSTTMVICSQKWDGGSGGPCQIKSVCSSKPETQVKSGLLIRTAN